MKRHTLSCTARSLTLCGFAAVSLLGAFACQDVDTRELGYTNDDTLDLTVAPDEPTEPFAIDVREFAGRWIGEAEESLAFGAGESAAPTYRFPSGSTHIVLDLAPPDDDRLGDIDYGYVTFGDGTAPPPPDDPDLGYPVGVDYNDLLTYFPDNLNAIQDRRPLPPTEGFAYPVYRQFFLADENPGDSPGVSDELFGAAPDGVLQVNYNPNDLLVPWCELQTPYPYVEGMYRCMPGVAYHGNGDGTCTPTMNDPNAAPCHYDLGSLEDAELEALLQDEAFVAACTNNPVTELDPIDCNKALLCDQQRCTCNSQSCYVDTFGQSVANLTLRLTGDTLIGEIDGGLFLNERGLRFPLGTIRFRRAP